MTKIAVNPNKLYTSDGLALFTEKEGVLHVSFTDKETDDYISIPAVEVSYITGNF